MEAQGSLLGSLLPLVVLFGIFYFLVIRPQQKQAKEHKKMVEELKKGDKIVTTGGIVVEIVKVTQEHLIVKNVDGSEMKLVKEYIASLVE